jgi:3-carboxy-cis,cis-muconate cycloisomerase
LIARVPVPARPYVHWGATSQDAIDTARVLQMREGLDVLVADLVGASDVLATLAESHRLSVMPGRTLLQQAVPITFGLKAARWLGAVSRQITGLRALRHDALVLQFGGAAGTLAALGKHGQEVAELLAAELALPLPDLPWHAERDRPARVVAALGVTAGIIAKVARDLVLMAQTEVAELAEGAAPGKGTSSAMPQKRNPVQATLTRSCAALAAAHASVLQASLVQEHQRAAGAWHAEWEALCGAFMFAGGASAAIADSLAGLDVDAARMRQNLDATGGLVLSERVATALAERLGRGTAHELVAAAAGAQSFRDALLADPRAGLEADEVDALLDPTTYLGSAGALVDRALARYDTETQGRKGGS